MLGALVLTSLPELLRALKDWRLVFYGLSVIVIMVTRPEGLMGGYEFTPSSMKKLIANIKSKRIAKSAAGGGEKV